MAVGRRLATLALGVTLWPLQAGAAEEIERSFHQRFAVAQGHRLVLEHGDGEVIVTPWDEDTLEIDVKYRARFTRVGLGQDPDFEVEMSQRRDTVRVVGRESGANVGFFSKRELEHRYTIRGPSYLSLELKGDDGDVSIERWHAPLRLDLDDGDLTLTDLGEADVRLSIEDGDVAIDGLTGELEIATDDGDLELRRCACKQVTIDSEDGDITIEDSRGSFDLSTDDGELQLTDVAAAGLLLRSSDGDITIDRLEADGRLELEIETDDGDVSLDLDGAVSARYDLRSHDGVTRVDAPGRNTEERRGRASGTLGGGEGSIRVVSRGGTIKLRVR